MLEKDFELITGFIDIYDSLEVDIIGEKIYPTKGGPQGSSIVPILFCYYLNNTIKNLKLKENLKLQAYADDMIILSVNIKDLSETFANLKQILVNMI